LSIVEIGALCFVGVLGLDESVPFEDYLLIEIVWLLILPLAAIKISTLDNKYR
jgi:hypothetical protein